MPNQPEASPELVGVRAWRLRQGLLWSLYRPVAWYPGYPARAECLSVAPTMPYPLATITGHPAPHRGCRCGLYAAHRASLESNRCSDTTEPGKWLYEALKAPNDDVVLGEVTGWGQAEIGTKGWRAAFCAIRAIYATHPEAGAVAERYDVPLVTP